ncbi:MAG TPA: bifunctional oligoribonuclease/PAP phosphatase NrnA [Mycobacteriales bacterium]|nr:bifunctional oligoribonuclease/PAP phosphatase NrnA [Mycobacteriales bacterium]
MTQLDWGPAVELLRDAGEVTLACHVSPDGDALGSMLGFGLALRARGARVVASYGDEPFAVPRTLAFLPGQELLVPPARFPAAPELMVTFDTGSLDRLGTLGEPAKAARRLLVVDHHASNTRFGTVHLLDPAAAATAVLVAKLLDRLGVALTPDVATALYTGLATDTGSFKFAATTPAVHRLAARLLGTGFRHDLVSRAVFDTASFGYLRVLGTVLRDARLELDAVGGLGLVWTVVEAAPRRACGVGMDEIEGVIDVLRRATEAEVAAVLKEGDDGTVQVSTRSKGRIDLSVVCRALGGGGHRYAAGYTSSVGPTETVERLRAELAGAPHLEA